MDPRVRPIVDLYQLSNGMLATSLKDLSDTDARARSRKGAGPSVAWTVGHLCHYKSHVLGLLGRPGDNAFAAEFGEAPASDGAGYPPLAVLAERFSSLNEALCEALLSEASRLDGPLPGAGPHAEKKVIESVLFFVWHEAYHIGAISAIRKDLGRMGLAELVQAR